MKQTFQIAVIAGALALVGCASAPDRTSEYAKAMDDVARAVDSGEFKKAHKGAMKLVGEIESSGVDEYGAQRALVDALLVDLHGAVTPGSEFLLEPEGTNQSIYGSKGKDGMVGSVNAHRLAAIFHAGHLIQSSDALSDASADVAPERLGRYLERGYAFDHAWLVTAATLAELGFDEQAVRILEEFDHGTHGRAFATTGDRQAHGKVGEILDEHGLSAAQRLHLYAAAHDLHRKRHESGSAGADPTLAYRFGVLAALGPLRDAADGSYRDHSGEGLGDDYRAEFCRWVAGLDGVFESNARTVFRDGVHVCEQTGQPALEFVWQPMTR